MVLTHQTLGSNAIFFRNRGGWQNMSYIQLSMVVEGAGKMYVPNRGGGSCSLFYRHKMVSLTPRVHIIC